MTLLDMRRATELAAKREEIARLTRERDALLKAMNAAHQIIAMLPERSMRIDSALAEIEKAKRVLYPEFYAG